MNFALELLDAPVEVAGQFGGQRLQPLELGVERLGLAVVVDPVLAGSRVDRLEAIVDLADGEPFFLAVIDAVAAGVVAAQLGAIFFQGLMDIGQDRKEFAADARLVEARWGGVELGHFVPAADFANGDPQGGDLLAQRRGQRQLGRAAVRDCGPGCGRHTGRGSRSSRGAPTITSSKPMPVSSLLRMGQRAEQLPSPSRRRAAPPRCMQGENLGGEV